MFNKKEFIKFMVQNNIVQFSSTPFSLKSGKQSHMYINWRIVSNNVMQLEHCCHYVISFCKTHHILPDCFFGVAEGASKLGILTQYLWAKLHPHDKAKQQLAMGRAKPKEHGSPADKFFIGDPNGSIVLLEDVTSTGMSMLATLDQLIAAEKKVIAVIGLTNRDEESPSEPSVIEKTAQRSVPYHSLSTASDILAVLPNQPH